MITYKGKEMPFQIQAGDIIIYRTEWEWYSPSTYLSAAIRWFTQCPYNHSALVVENNGVLFINEALAGGVTARPLENHLDRGSNSFFGVLRSKTPVDPIQFSIHANEKVSTKYDFESLIFNQTVYRIPKLLGFKHFGPWIGHTNQFAEGKMVCSEYCAWAHGDPNWWTLSTAELLGDEERYDLLWEEKKLSTRKAIIN
jgi:hypothetical protein